MPPKRKAGQTDASVDDDVQPRRSTRQRTSTTAAAIESANTPKKTTTKKPAATAKKAATPKATKSKAKQKQQADDGDDGKQAAPPAAGDETKKPKPNGVKGKAKKPAKSTATKTEEPPKDVAEDQGRQYWLMKAEPESRIENGVDVRFSIDDLAAKDEPEPWDGMSLKLSIHDSNYLFTIL